jgi:putative glutamine amidotransferase
MSKPIIGVTPLWDEERQSVWMLPEYLDAIRAAGGIPVILPLTADDSDIHQLIATVDGVLLTGGPDVSPELYGETDRTGLVKTCPKRDALEVMVLKEALHKDKPVLGICRGIQLLNSALGGSLWQDLPSEHPSEITHRQAAPYENPTHCVVLSGPLKDLTGKSEIKVNSRHHQAVKAVSPLLTPMAFSPDNLVEAVYMRDKRFVWAVQWHPEYLYKKDPDASAIFEALINSCRA